MKDKILVAISDYQSELSFLYHLTDEQIKLLDELKIQQLLADGVFFDEVKEISEV